MSELRQGEFCARVANWNKHQHWKYSMDVDIDIWNFQGSSSALEHLKLKF